MSFKQGDYVRIREDAANPAREIMSVVRENDATCEVEVAGRTSAFLFGDLEKAHLKLVP